MSRLKRPQVNSTSNAYTNQCVGNKADYAVETPSDTASIMAYVKALVALPKCASFGGNMFFVDSGHAAKADAATGGAGTSPHLPFATIDYAIGKCTANNGDVIFVMPGHAESVAAAAGINVDVAGISIVGLGSGASRPTITISHADGTVAIGANDCYISNLLFTVTADATIVIDVNKKDFTIENCEFRYGTGKEWVTCIDINGGGANTCDRATIRNCVFQSPVAGADNCIGLDEVADRVLIEGCVFRGDFADAAIHNPTGKVLTQLRIVDCDIENTQAGDHAVELVSACTGTLVRNYYSTNALATAVDPGSCFSFECYANHSVDKNGVLTPAVDS